MNTPIEVAQITQLLFVSVQVREQKGIDGSFIGDLLLICCCYCCALTQEAQEVNAIGSMNMARQ